MDSSINEIPEITILLTKKFLTLAGIMELQARELNETKDLILRLLKDVKELFALAMAENEKKEFARQALNSASLVFTPPVAKSRKETKKKEEPPSSAKP